MPKIVAGIEFPDDATPAEIREVLAQEGVEAETSFGRPIVRAAGRKALRGLTDAGGMLGSAAASRFPAPVRAAVAGIGGAAGRATENFAASLLGYPDVPQTPEQVLSSLGVAFGEQAATEAAGMGLARIARAAAVPIMQYGLRMSPEQAKQAARAVNASDDDLEPDYHHLARVALRERIPSGSAARRAGQAAEKAVENRVAASVARGERASIADIAQELIAANEKSFGRPLTAAERRGVMAEVRAAANAALGDMRPGAPTPNKTTFNADELRQIKRRLQSRKAPEYAAEARGKFKPNPTTDRKVASAARRQVDQFAGTIPLDAQVQDMMLLEQAFEANRARMAPSLGQWVMGAGGAIAGGGVADPASALGYGALGLFGSQPRTSQLASYAMTDPFVQRLIEQTPRAVLMGGKRLFEPPEQP